MGTPYEINDDRIIITRPERQPETFYFTKEEGDDGQVFTFVNEKRVQAPTPERLVDRIVHILS